MSGQCVLQQERLSQHPASRIQYSASRIQYSASVSSGDPASQNGVRVPGAGGCSRLSAQNPFLSAGLAGELACVTGVGPQAVAELSVLWEAAEHVCTASFSPHQWGIV